MAELELVVERLREAYARGHEQEALDGFRRLVRRCDTELRPSSPLVLSLKHNYAVLLGHSGQLDAAISMLTDLVPRFQETYGPGRETLLASASLAGFLAMTGREPALDDLARVCAELEGRYGPDDQEVRRCRHNLEALRRTTASGTHAVDPRAMGTVLPVDDRS